MTDLHPPSAPPIGAATAGPAAPEASARATRWLSLGPASRLLGIDPDTLRRWADDGRVEAWVTPGGHRRFDRRQLEGLAADRSRHGSRRPLATLGASPERLTRVYRRHYAADRAPGPERDAHRESGRRLLGAVTAYLDADPDDASARERAEADARRVVDEQAARLAAAGSSLTDSVSAFVAARQPFLAELTSIGRRRSLDPNRLAGLYGDASALLDRLLLRFIDAHQRGAG